MIFKNDIWLMMEMFVFGTFGSEAALAGTSRQI